jgi:hypothetical protein
MALRPNKLPYTPLAKPAVELECTQLFDEDNNDEFVQPILTIA